MDRDAFQRARQLYLAGDRQAATTLVERAIDDDENDGVAWELLGVILHGKRDYHIALHALETATTLKVLSLGGQLSAASCYRKLDFPETARAILIHLADQGGLPARYLPDVTLGLGEVGEFARALRLSRVAVQQDPFCDQALYAVAHYMGKCGYPLACILPVMHKVVDLAPEIVRYQVSLAVLYLKQGQQETARQLLTRLSPKQIETIGCLSCLNQIAQVYDEAGDDVRRDCCLRRVEQIRPA